MKKLFLLLFLLPILPAKASEKNNLKWLIGKWKCEYQTEVINKNQKTKSQSKGIFKVRNILKGKWLKGEYTLSGKPAYKTLSHYAYNPKTKSYVMNFMDEWGGWGDATAKNNSESVFRFEGKSYYENYINNYVKEFTKINDQEYKVLLKLSNKKSKYFITAHGVCKK